MAFKRFGKSFELSLKEKKKEKKKFVLLIKIISMFVNVRI